jgi:hypothetical protein
MPMRNTPFGVAIALLWMVLVAVPATAQKGTGETTGVAQQAVKPPIEGMSGTIKDIKIGPCERTTGRSSEGVHLIVQTKDGQTINLHLGPAAALDDALDQLSAGQQITFEAFILAAMSVGTPARMPLSTSVFLVHSFSVCAVQPILLATDAIAAHREGCSCS